jgi:diaminohydroxyphosphoribosylaminopyrimidine deaminase / 5-amino-6-(5-phosphoribosylamino)uracil reductase
MDFIAEGTKTVAGTRRPEAGSLDERVMLRALDLAEMGRGLTSPNPMVGAVVAFGEEIVGEGFHARAGGPHAEVVALEGARKDPRGATVYVNLEPCSHQGRTPPCADMLVGKGIARVVISMLDPNPMVSGGGMSFLVDSGVDVSVGPFGELALKLNEAYVKWITTRLPFVTLKMAMSLDGKVATRTGDSKWISSERSRDDVQEMRRASDAVMVGIGTVVQDDPRLTVRAGEGGTGPLRVVVDSLARTPLDSNVVDTAVAPTLIAVSDAAPPDRVSRLSERGVEVVHLDAGGKVDLTALLGLLGDREVVSLQVEGGPELTRAMWEAGLVDKLVFYYAPKVIAGCGAPGPIGGSGIARMEEAQPLVIDSVFEMGPDFKVVAYPEGV